ncbi:MAG: MFS family permease, partial [Acidimicrobiales bacterium]
MSSPLSQVTAYRPRDGGSPWPVFAVCAISFAVVMFDLAVVNVAFPDILSDFEITRADGSWMVSLYNIFFGSLLLVAGKTADSVGRRKMLRIGLATFGAGAAVSALAPNLAMLLAGRAVQGIGAALLTPAALGLAVAAFPVERRTQTMAYWGAVGASGVSSGPSIGAAMIQVMNWRAAFWVPFAVCTVLLVASGRVLKESPTSNSDHRPDYFGAGLVTAAMASLVLGVSRSGAWGWTSPATLGSIAIGLSTTGLFVARQRD